MASMPLVTAGRTSYSTSMSSMASSAISRVSAATPFNALAFSTLMLFILAWAWGLRLARPMSSCGRLKSSRKVHLPVTISRASLRGTFTRPT